MRYYLRRILSMVVFFATTLLLATVTFALAADEDWQVVVYENANYQGKSLVYSIQPWMCQKLEPQLSKAKMNNKLSSVKVGKNVHVHLYQHKNYDGELLTLTDSKQSLSPYMFNNKVSSLIVYPRTALPVGVLLQGSKRSFYPAGDTCGGASYPHLVHNNDATMVNIHTSGGCKLKATIFENSDFKGKFQTSTVAFNIGKDLLRKTSSLKMEVIGKCPVRTQ
jgi:hypothetical protein